MKKSASSLRAARQNRIKARAEESKGAQSYKFTQKEADVPETLVANVLDPKSISKTANITMHLYNKDHSDPHWLVCADGQPVAQIRLSDQEDPEKIAKLFTTDQYAHSIVESAKQLELPEILSGVKARPFVAAIESSEVFKNVRDSIAKEASENLRKARANLRGDMINVLNMVVTAQTKNFLSENELKSATFRLMREAGIEADRAVAIVEAAWQKSASKYFEDTFKQASKWMDLSPEAFAEMKEQIVGMPNRTPDVSIESEDAPVPSYPKQASNVPLTTQTDPSVNPNANRTASVNEKESLRDKLGFRTRVLNKQIANR